VAILKRKKPGPRFLAGATPACPIRRTRPASKDWPRASSSTFEQRTACRRQTHHFLPFSYGSPGLNGASFPGGVDSSAIANSMATET
jgi:hypothetical protein